MSGRINAWGHRWLTSQWSAPRVVTALIADGRSTHDKIWIILYFASRLRFRGWRPLGWIAPSPRKLTWHSSPSALCVSVQSGGLSPWYETSIVRVYAPAEGFEPQPGWTVVDIGANIGAYSVWAAGRVGSSGRLLAIEPNPVSFEQLLCSMEGLPVKATAIQAACGDSGGSITLHFEEGYTVSSSIHPFDAATDSVSIQMFRLEDLLRESSIQRIDMLKIDVEGAEELVLRGAGASLAQVQRIVLETTQGAIGSAVRSFLVEQGFVLVHEESMHWAIAGLELLAFDRGRPADPPQA